MRVLIVEDSDDLRHLFARVLRGNRCAVYEAADGTTALQAVEKFIPDLVMTDLMMPVMDGVELIRRMRAMPAMDDVPIVLITADASSDARRQGCEAGAAEVLIKPIDVGGILGMIESYRPTRPGTPPTQ